jgi:hypothetical protein
MHIASIGASVLIARTSGDRPGTITKVLGSRMAEVCALTPLPELLNAVELHSSRCEAINGALKDGADHAYWQQR